METYSGMTQPLKWPRPPLHLPCISPTSPPASPLHPPPHLPHISRTSPRWAVKFHRVRSVHVTPTVFVNGLEAGVVSSGWGGAEWQRFLQPMGADNWQGTQL